MRHFGQLAVAQGAEQVAEQALFQENFVNKGFDDGKVEIAAVFGNDPVGFVADDGGGGADEIAVQPLLRPLPVGLVIGLHGLDFIERVFQQLGNFSRVFQLFERKQDVLQKTQQCGQMLRHALYSIGKAARCFGGTVNKFSRSFIPKDFFRRKKLRGNLGALLGRERGENRRQLILPENIKARLDLVDFTAYGIGDQIGLLSGGLLVHFSFPCWFFADAIITARNIKINN